jgi:hypothetical protein
LLCSQGWQSCLRDNDIDSELDELGRDLGETLVAPLSPAILDGYGSILDPTEFAQSLHKSSGPLAPRQSRGSAQESDGRQLRRLLRLRGERPRSRRAADERDEIAPLQLIEPHLLPSRTTRQHTALARVESGARCSAGFRSGLRPQWVNS